MTRRWSALLAVALAFHCTVPRAAAEEPTPERVVADVIVVRPAGIVIVAAGAVAMLVAIPFAAMARCAPQTAETLVGKPSRLIFCRRLGDFEPMRHDAIDHHPRR